MGGDIEISVLVFKNILRSWDKIEGNGKTLASAFGAYDAQMNFELAAIGGKDSMSGTYQDINVPPTLISFACANGEKKAYRFARV